MNAIIKSDRWYCSKCGKDYLWYCDANICCKEEEDEDP